MSDNVQKIKKEIERLKNTPVNAYDRSRFTLLLEIEDFIDSLPEDSNVENKDECPCCGWSLDSDGCCGSCGYGRK